MTIVQFLWNPEKVCYKYIANAIQKKKKISRVRLEEIQLVKYIPS